MNDRRPDVREGRRVADRYRVGATLRNDSDRRVHRAHDELLDRVVTLTVVPPPARGSLREDVDRLRPAVVELLDAGACADGVFQVTPLVRGPTLAEACASGDLMPAGLVELGAWCAALLSTAHARGLVHGSLTPDRLRLAGGRLVVEEYARDRGTGPGRDASADVLALGTALTQALAACVEPDRRTGHRVAGLLAAMTADDPARRPSAAAVATGLGAAAPPDGTAGPDARPHPVGDPATPDRARRPVRRGRRGRGRLGRARLDRAAPRAVTATAAFLLVAALSAAATVATLPHPGRAAAPAAVGPAGSIAVPSAGPLPVTDPRTARADDRATLPASIDVSLAADGASPVTPASPTAPTRRAAGPIPGSAPVAGPSGPARGSGGTRSSAPGAVPPPAPRSVVPPASPSRPSPSSPLSPSSRSGRSGSGHGGSDGS